MTVSKIWVFAEASDGKVSNTTLEMLTKARELADTVECVSVAAADVAGAVGAHGATAVHQAPTASCSAPPSPRPSPGPSPRAPVPTPCSSPPATTGATSPVGCR